MIGIRGGVDASQALAAAHEVEEGLSARRRGQGVLGIVEELARGAGQEERVVLREVLLAHVRGVVGDRGRPGTGLPAHLLDGARGQRDRRVHVASGPPEDEHPARPARDDRRLVGKGGQHGLHIRGFRGLVLGQGRQGGLEPLRELLLGQ
jgi:hypothetical protein